MTRSVIDPITRIEGHLRVEMEVNNGKVTDAWVSGGCFRGMEMVVENRTPEDAAQIVQRICGVCPVSHAHSSAIAAEKAYGIKISNNARIIRNLLEGAQFLHSHILWFYNLAALDYVNPLNALKADAADAYDLAQAAGTSMNSDFAALKERLASFADNGQLSIFSGNWFDAEEGTAYQLPPELDLICTAHYLEALTMQAKASQRLGPNWCSLLSHSLKLPGAMRKIRGPLGAGGADPSIPIGEGMSQLRKRGDWAHAADACSAAQPPMNSKIGSFMAQHLSSLRPRSQPRPRRAIRSIT